MPVFAALGDPVRLAIVAMLCRDGPLPTFAIKETARVSRQGLTKHLKLLEDVGIVQSHRVGRDRQWQIEIRRMAEVRTLLDQISAEWDARLERLRAFVEDE